MMETAHWQIRKYVPDSDDDSDEDNFAHDENEQYASGGHHTSESSLLNTKQDEGHPLKHDKQTSDEQEYQDGQNTRERRQSLDRAPSHFDKLSQETESAGQEVQGIPKDGSAGRDVSNSWNIDNLENQTIIHNVSSPRGYTATFSDSLSPLSSIPDTPLSLSPRFSPQQDREESQTLPSNVEFLGPPEVFHLQEYLPARQLRERKAIQLNPYAVEGQMYKQAWRSRGLVPLQIKTNSQAEINEPAHPSSSQLEYESQSSDDARSISDTRMDNGGLDGNTNTLPNEESFSTIQPTTETTAESLGEKASKRRKLAHTYSRRSKHQPDAFTSGNLHVREDGWIEVPFAHNKAISPTEESHSRINTKSTSRTISGSFPSVMTPVSVHSSSTLSSPRLPVDTDLHIRSAAIDEDPPLQQLQTPATSSDVPTHRKKKIYRRQLSVHSLPRSMHEDGNNSVTSDGSISVDGDDNEQILRQITKAQRRTKGVLPASWHRLEYQKLMHGRPQAVPKQQTLSRIHRSSIASPSKDVRKGIAKRITGTQRRMYGNDPDSISHAIIDIESDSEEDNATAPQHKQQLDIGDFFPINENFTSLDDNEYDDYDDDTSMEDNSVDPMIGRGHTDKSHDRRRRKTTQPKINDYITSDHKHQERQNLLTNSSHTVNEQSRRKASTSNKQQKQIRNILDITSRLTREQTPNFLAYAVRTARQQKRARRPSSTHKHKRLLNVKESRKRQQHLQVARDNSNSRAKNSSFIPREPLHERSLNDSQFPTTLHEDEDLEGEDGFQQPQSLTTEARENLHPGVDGGADPPVASVQMNKFIVRGFPITSVTGLARPTAPAQLETINHNRRHRHAIQRDGRLVLDRFLQRSALRAESCSSLAPASNPVSEPISKVRKRPPRHIPITVATENNQNGSWESNSGELSSTETQAAISSNVSGLQGLLPFGTEYPTTFSVSRLPDGCHFHTDTLIGSGTFLESLNISLEHVNLTPFRVTMDRETVEWRGWNETVAQQVFDICNGAVDSATSLGQAELFSSDLTSNLAKRLRFVIRYLSGYLKFLDPIDCEDFVVRWTALMNKYDDQFSVMFLNARPKAQLQAFTTDIVCHIAIIANQIRQIAHQSPVEDQTKGSISKVSARILQHLVRTAIRGSFEDFRVFTQDAVNLSGHVSRNKISQKIEALVVISSLYQNLDTPVHTTWDVLRELDILVLPRRLAISELEQIWKNLFSLLPILELDCSGQAPKHVLPLSRPNNWRLVKQLIEPVFAAYPNTTKQSTIHQYCRALYTRCYSLLDYWGWNDCESIMGFLFDFFAQNKLHDLRLEFSPSSTSFLNNLTSTTNLDIRASDRCFDILLKFIGKGLKLMRTQYKDKRISNCIWRLTPNHDRSLPKDESLRQEDLNAVHNHLDLLVVLYWAAPPQHRIRVDLIQRLIDIENSHKEVCHLVIKTWSNLMSFQLSTQESADKLDAFIRWYEEIIIKSARLHQLARTEVESDAKRAEALGGQHFTKDDQERIIQASQRNVQSVVIDALSSLKSAILKTETAENLRKLLPGSLRLILELWQVSRSNTSQLAIQVLTVMQAWTLRAQYLRSTDDSQGYGDWSGIQELAPDIASQTSLTVPTDLQQALHDFISGVFGSEVAIQDNLLQNSIHCWLDIAELEVTAGNLMWDDLVDSYAPRSWIALRDTAQTRRFTPLFLALLIERDPNVYQRKKSMIMQCWIECLVERESLIKYQPNLTSALLNQGIAEPLFQNQPFSKTNDKFEILLADFLDQRISLITCLLSNMRESLSFSMYHQLQGHQAKRQDYSDLLRHLMNTMKGNFQSLGQGSDLQGAYVIFTQKIVQSLQEHTADICKVDSFFLDAVNFPLPLNDPEYLVSKFKSLALQLQNSRGWQQLGAFIQSVCERAVIERKQSHFASLIFSATEDIFEASQGEYLTLRFFLCCEILPSYVDAVSNTPCGWIIAETLLLSVPMMLQSLLLNIDAFDAVSMAASKSIILEVLDNVSRSLSRIIGQGLDHDIRAFTVVTRYFAIIESVLDASDYVARCSSDGFDQYTELMTYFANAALHVIGKLEHLEPSPDCPATITNTSNPNRFQSVQFEAARKFIRESLHDSLDSTSRKCKWRVDEDKLFVHRNARWDVVESDLKSGEHRQQELLLSARSLLEKMQRTPLFSWIVTETMAQQSGIARPRLTIGGLDGLPSMERAYLY